MSIPIRIILSASLLVLQGLGQDSSPPQSGREKSVLVTNRGFPKGGLGPVRPGLYIVVDSAKNELLLKDGKRWVGQRAGKREVVFFFEDRIWALGEVPSGFDLSRAVVISFEADVVRVFEFDSMSGGYYKRLKPE